MEEKLIGNKLFASHHLQEAIVAYSTGIDRVMSEEENCSKEDKDQLPILHMNRSKCRIEVGDIDDALYDADVSVFLNDKFGKAYARRAAARIEVFAYPQALHDLDRAVVFDPSLDVKDLRAIASLKKWSPNWYLRRQIDLLLTHTECRYVLNFIQGEKKLELPFETKDSELDEKLGEAFTGAVKAGKQSAVGDILRLILANKTPAMEAAVNEKFGDSPNTFTELLVAQLHREYGHGAKEALNYLAGLSEETREKKQDGEGSATSKKMVDDMTAEELHENIESEGFQIRKAMDPVDEKILRKFLRDYRNEAYRKETTQAVANHPTPQTAQQRANMSQKVGDYKLKLLTQHPDLDPKTVDLWAGEVRMDDEKYLYDYPAIAEGIEISCRKNANWKD